MLLRLDQHSHYEYAVLPCRLELFFAEKCLRKFQETLMEKFCDLKIFAKIHHDCNHYITNEIFCDFEHSKSSQQYSLANSSSLQYAVVIAIPPTRGIVFPDEVSYHSVKCDRSVGHGCRRRFGRRMLSIASSVSAALLKGAVSHGNSSRTTGSRR